MKVAAGQVQISASALPEKRAEGEGWGAGCIPSQTGGGGVDLQPHPGRGERRQTCCIPNQMSDQNL